jgi:hypothetical protein
MVVLVARAEGVLIEMLYSDDPRRLERAAEKILSSLRMPQGAFGQPPDALSAAAGGPGDID